MQLSSQSLQEEREEVKKRMEENTARLLQLEEDLIGVTQKGLQKETELDWCVFFVFLKNQHLNTIPALFHYVRSSAAYYSEKDKMIATAAF